MGSEVGTAWGCSEAADYRRMHSHLALSPGQGGAHCGGVPGDRILRGAQVRDGTGRDDVELWGAREAVTASRCDCGAGGIATLWEARVSTFLRPVLWETEQPRLVWCVTFCAPCPDADTHLRRASAVSSSPLLVFGITVSPLFPPTPLLAAQLALGCAVAVSNFGVLPLWRSSVLLTAPGVGCALRHAKLQLHPVVSFNMVGEHVQVLPLWKVPVDGLYVSETATANDFQPRNDSYLLSFHMPQMNQGVVSCVEAPVGHEVSADFVEDDGGGKVTFEVSVKPSVDVWRRNFIMFGYDHVIQGSSIVRGMFGGYVAQLCPVSRGMFSVYFLRRARSIQSCLFLGGVAGGMEAGPAGPAVPEADVGNTTTNRAVVVVPGRGLPNSSTTRRVYHLN